MRGRVLIRKKIFQNNLSYDVPTILFFAGFFLHELSVIIDTSMFAYSANESMTPLGFFAKIIRFTAYGVMLLKIIYDCGVGKKNIFFLYAAAGITGLSFIASRNSVLVFYLLIMIAAIGISDRTVLLSTIIAQSLMLFITVSLSMVNVIENAVNIDRKGRVREFLGFQWATTAPILFLFIVFGGIYLNRGRLSLIGAVLINVVNVFLFILTDSRMAFLVTFVTTLHFLCFGHLMKKGSFARTLKWIFIALPWLFAVFSIYLHKIYTEDSAFLVKLNAKLSNRLYLGNRGIKEYGIHLFGNKIKWVGYSIGETDEVKAGGYNFVDCSYLQILLEYGVLFLLLILVIYSFIIYKAYKSNKYYAVWILAIILMFGMTEPRLLNLLYNPFILLACAGMIKEKEQRINKEEILSDGDKC